MTPDREKLRQLAERASSHDWAASSQDSREPKRYIYAGEFRGRIAVVEPGMNYGQDMFAEVNANAEYIVAAQPAAVLSLLDEMEQLEAERGALKAAKWDVKHVDTMNDMVAMGMARDAAIAERDALRAALVEAREALQPFALAIKDHIPDETLITNVAWDAGQHRRAASVHSRLSGEGE